MIALWFRKPLTEKRAITLWIKIPYTLFVCLLVPAYWAKYGPANFLWFSDAALLGTLAALWLESRLLVSMMALAVLLPEVGWNIDFFTRLIAGADAIGVRGTNYMFDPAIPIFFRALSSFHIFLPLVLLWAVHRLGYDPRAFVFQILLAWIMLPASYLFTDPVHNVNFVLGVGSVPQSWMPALLYVAMLMALVPVCIYLPTHLVLKKFAGL